MSLAGTLGSPKAGADKVVDKIVLRRVSMPLHKPFTTAYATFHEFEPVVVETHLGDGSVGWGEGQIAPGSSKETREGGWRAAVEWARAIAGQPVREGCEKVLSERARSPVAASAVVTSLEMAGGNPVLAGERDLSIPLLVPISGKDPAAIEREIDECIAQGFTTFKVKVGPDVSESLGRMKVIQAAGRGRATFRMDANRSFTREQGIAFASGLDPANIELFEQPCAADAWDDNAAVAAVSSVPLMLDESISTLDDILRAARLKGVGFCKLKLKRFGGIDVLRHAMHAASEHGMRTILGDGLSSDLGCWLEACAGADLMHGAGEFNGFLKPVSSLMIPPLACRDARLVIPRGYRPAFEAERLADRVLETKIIHPVHA